MKKRFTLIIFLYLITSGSYEFYGQNGHHIEFNIKYYDGKELTLAYHYGEKQYIQSQLTRQESGKFIASGKEELKPGMYLVALASSKKSFDFLVNKGEQHFKLSTDTKGLIANMNSEGSPENTRFFKYLNYLDKQRKAMSQLNKEIKQIQTSKANNKTQKLTEKQKEIEKLNASVNAYQNAIIDMEPNSFTSKIIKANIPIQVPQNLNNNNKKAFAYYREHFLDNLDFSDERFVRSPIIHQKVSEYYSDQLTGLSSKMAIENVDKVLKLSAVNKEMYKLNLIAALNTFAKSKTPCMSSTYVHIVDNYYAKGEASWIDEEQLKKIKIDADKLRNIKCGKIAPDLSLRSFENLAAQINLNEVIANYTLLLFWNPDDDDFSQEIKKLVNFYGRVNKDKFKVFTVCNVDSKTESINKCKNAIKNYKMERFINTIDLKQDSQFERKYFVNYTPVAFLLNAKKKIIVNKSSISTILKILNN